MHPWLTALSVVGGIYYFGGAAGAIYGPLVLCAALVVLSVYPSLVSFGFPGFFPECGRNN